MRLFFLLLSLAPAAAFAAPLNLMPPQGNDGTGFSSTTVPGTTCGTSLNAPCQGSAGQASLSFAPPPNGGFTFGGSIGAGVGAVSGAKGPVTTQEGSLWVRSPDGNWTVSVGVSHFSGPGYAYGTPYPYGGPVFGHH